LSKSPSLARVIHAIECRPSLLFLIRLAPYPYNVMNTLLASSRTLSLKVYVGVTGVSLFKLMCVRPRFTTLGDALPSDIAALLINSASTRPSDRRSITGATTMRHLAASWTTRRAKAATPLGCLQS
jgi:hypothetical protein